MLLQQKIQDNSQIPMGLPGGSIVKNLPAMQELQETWVPSLGWEDPLEEGMATHSSILAWRILWREEPGRLQSIGSQSDMTQATQHAGMQAQIPLCINTHTNIHTHTHTQLPPIVLFTLYYYNMFTYMPQYSNQMFYLIFPSAHTFLMIPSYSIPFLKSGVE